MTTNLLSKDAPIEVGTIVQLYDMSKVVRVEVTEVIEADSFGGKVVEITGGRDSSVVWEIGDDLAFKRADVRWVEG